MSSLIRKLEDVGKSNDIITPDSSDFDEPSPTNDVKTTIIKSTIDDLKVDVDNEIIKKSPLVESVTVETEEESSETVIDISSNEQ